MLARSLALVENTEQTINNRIASLKKEIASLKEKIKSLEEDEAKKENAIIARKTLEKKEQELMKLYAAIEDPDTLEWEKKTALLNLIPFLNNNTHEYTKEIKFRLTECVFKGTLSSSDMVLVKSVDFNNIEEMYFYFAEWGNRDQRNTSRERLIFLLKKKLGFQSSIVEEKELSLSLMRKLFEDPDYAIKFHQAIQKLDWVTINSAYEDYPSLFTNIAVNGQTALDLCRTMSDFTPEVFARLLLVINEDTQLSMVTLNKKLTLPMLADISSETFYALLKKEKISLIEITDAEKKEKQLREYSERLTKWMFYLLEDKSNLDTPENTAKILFLIKFGGNLHAVNAEKIMVIDLLLNRYPQIISYLAEHLQQFPMIQNDIFLLRKLANAAAKRSNATENLEEKNAQVSYVLAFLEQLLNLARKEDSTLEKNIEKVLASYTGNAKAKDILQKNQSKKQQEIADQLGKTVIAGGLFSRWGASFKLTDQARKGNVYAKLSLAHGYFKTNKMEKALAIYEELARYNEYAEWMVLQIKLKQSPMDRDLIYDALLSSFRALVSDDTKSKEVISFIDSYIKNQELEQDLKFFANLLKAIALNTSHREKLNDFVQGNQFTERMARDILHTVESYNFPLHDELKSWLTSQNQIVAKRNNFL